MQKSKLVQWPTKTIIILFSTIVSTIVFLIVVGIITMNLGKAIENEQQERFDTAVDSIQMIVDSGNDYSLLDTFVKSGYQIVITDSSGTINYPIVTTAYDTSDNKLGLILFSNKGFVKTLTIDNQHVFISYPVQLKTPEINKIILNSVPYVLLSVIFCITCMIFIYLYLFKRERRKLDVLFDMTKKEISSEEIKALKLNMRLQEYAEIETQIKELYFQLKRTQLNLEKEVQLVKKLETNNSALLKGMTHEMKTPLMSTKLLVNQLEMQNPSLDASKILAEISHQTNNLDQLIREILFISKKNNFTQNTKESVTEIIKKVLYNYDVLLVDKKLTIKTEFRDEFFMVLDPKLIEKVYSNLISNAINYAVESSELVISISSEGFSIVNEITEDDRIDFSLIGNPFTTFGSASGTGLGIYLINTMLVNSNYTLSTFIKEKRFFHAKISNLEETF